MKKYLFLLALLCLSLTDTIGQNNTSFLQGANQLETLYSNFQANNTPTGILYGQSLLTFNQDYYAFTNDTATHSRLSYEILHRTMYDCKTPNNTWLANPDPFLSEIRTSFDEPSNSVDFLLAAMHFNEIEPSGNIDKIQLVNNALELNSGYTLTDVLSEKSAHASMLTKSRCFAGEVNFTLPSENIQSNVSIDALKISMDGISFTPLTIDSSYAYTLSPTENQAVYLQMTIAGQVITTKLLLDVIRKKDFQQENAITRNPHDNDFLSTLPGTNTLFYIL